VGKFSGLEKIDAQGKQQETIRIVYSNNDLLYVSIHSLHKISKFVGKDGTPPKVHKLGSDTWKKLKNKTKSKIKEVAFDLIKLYAERKSKKGKAETKRKGKKLAKLPKDKKMKKVAVKKNKANNKNKRKSDKGKAQVKRVAKKKPHKKKGMGVGAKKKKKKKRAKKKPLKKKIVEPKDVQMFHPQN
jgi:hypothetical protein